MKTEEKRKKTVTMINENSLNFELAKLKQRIQANYSSISKTNLYIFTKEHFANA
jgi:hypothetical protein